VGIRWVVAGGLAAAAVGAATVVAADGNAPAARTGGATGTLAWTNGRLVRVAPATLAPRGESVAIGEGSSALSPDRTKLAVGDTDAPRVRLVDLTSMRVDDAPVTLERHQRVDTMKWLDARTLAVLVWGAPPALLHVDVAQRRVVRTRAIDGVVFARAATQTSLVLLVGPSDRIGASHLLVVDAERGVRRVPLTEISSGYAPTGGARSGDNRRISPGLAADPTGRRAVVVPPGERVAEVDLTTLAVEYHALSRPVSLLRRLGDWLEPPAHAKSVQGPERQARWVGDHTVVVTGIEQVGIRPKQGSHRQLARATGVDLIDTRSWSVRTLSSVAGSAVVAGGSVLVYGGPFAAGGGFSADRGSPVTGLTGYSLGGQERFSLFDGRHVRQVAAEGRYAYVYGDDGRSIAVVDAAKGIHVRTVRTRAPVFIVAR
jgi:hypothetical protein